MKGNDGLIAAGDTQDGRGHVDWAEIQRTQIAQMGIENYLNQTGGAAG